MKPSTSPTRCIQSTSKSLHLAGSNPAVLSTAGRGRVNIHGTVNLETFDATFVEPTTVDGLSAVQLLSKIEESNPEKRIIHVIWDNAA